MVLTSYLCKVSTELRMYIHSTFHLSGVFGLPTGGSVKLILSSSEEAIMRDATVPLAFYHSDRFSAEIIAEAV